MSLQDDVIRMKHMLDCAREAVVLMQSRTRAELETTRLLQLGLARLIEIIGEAAARVSNVRMCKTPSDSLDRYHCDEEQIDSRLRSTGHGHPVGYGHP